MKDRKERLTFTAMALALMVSFASCTDYTTEGESSDTRVGMYAVMNPCIDAKTIKGSSNSNFQYVWIIGEEVGAVSGEGKNTRQIGLRVKDVKEKRGILAGLGKTIPDSKYKYQSYMPLQKGNVDFESGVGFSFRNQLQRGNDNTGHLPAYWFSIAGETAAKNQEFTFSYTRQCAHLIIDVSVWGTHTWKSLALMPSDVTKPSCRALLCDSLCYDFMEQKLLSIPSRHNLLSLDLDSICTDAQEVPEHIICHMMVAPSQMNGSKLNVRLVDDQGDVWIATINGQDFEANHDYTLTALMSESPTYARVNIGDEGNGEHRPVKVQWAEMNFGAHQASEAGAFFAWGETKEKENGNYDFLHYFDCKYYQETSADGRPLGSFESYKYFFGDGGKTELEPEDDPVRIYWGGAWRMPTFEDARILTKVCTGESDWSRSLCYFKSSLTGQTLVFPLAGWKYQNHTLGEGEYSYVWTSTQYESSAGNGFGNSTANCLTNEGMKNQSRACGLPIRPVWDSELLK